jgi:Ni,Fe-hydrogenase I small subunit
MAGRDPSNPWAADGGGEFQRFCSEVAARIGGDEGLATRVGAFLSVVRRLPLVWFQLQPAGGRQDTFARCTSPWAGDMLFAQVPDDGGAEREADPATMSKLKSALRAWSGKYLCVIEGSLPDRLRREGGTNRALQVAVDICSNARAVLCVGGAATALSAIAPTVLATHPVHVPGSPPTAVAFAVALVTNLLAFAPALAPALPPAGDGSPRVA